MDEFTKVIKELKKSTFAVELYNGKVVSFKGETVDILMTKLLEDEEFLMDALVGVKVLDRVGALLMVQANVCGVYAETITNDAEDILEYFAIETEYVNKVEDTSKDKKKYYNAVKNEEDPMEVFKKLRELF